MLTWYIPSKVVPYMIQAQGTIFSFCLELAIHYREEKYEYICGQLRNIIKKEGLDLIVPSYAYMEKTLMEFPDDDYGCSDASGEGEEDYWSAPLNL